MSGKHPISALLEYCTRRKFKPPVFEVVNEAGPDHKKNFLIKVTVNNKSYEPGIASHNKKLARATAAAACLAELGAIPKSMVALVNNGCQSITYTLNNAGNMPPPQPRPPPRHIVNRLGYRPKYSNNFGFVPHNPNEPIE